MGHAILKQAPNAPLPVADYAHAEEVPINDDKSFLYLCGMGPREKETNAVPGIELDAHGAIAAYDIEAQTRNVFNNIDIVIKDAGGQGLRDVIDVQVYLVDIPKDFVAFNKIWKEFMVFDDGWMPTRTTVQVAALPLPEIFVELKCVAVIDKSK